jgi:hypothetical protein
VAEARGRNDNHDNGSKNSRPSTGQQSRPAGRPGNSGKRPGGNHGNPRPGGNHGNPRPGGNHGNPRPGSNHGNPRPGSNQGHPRPGNPPQAHHPKPGHGHGHGHGHSHKHEHYYRPTPPSRPYLPPSRPYYRPAPPRAWRPAATWRPFHTVLGVSFGSAINVSLNLLLNSGYTVQSYGPNAIYLSNVPMMNYYWPDATMYYNNGTLAGSEFVYYTPYANTSRYDMVFNALCGSYGTPVSVVNKGGLVTSSWWGPGNQYISLSYGGQYAGNGSLGYYTTLTFGI